MVQCWVYLGGRGGIALGMFDYPVCNGTLRGYQYRTSLSELELIIVMFCFYQCFYSSLYITVKLI